MEFHRGTKVKFILRLQKVAPQQRFAEDSPHGWQKPLKLDILEEVSLYHGPLNNISSFDWWSAVLCILLF